MSLKSFVMSLFSMNISNFVKERKYFNRTVQFIVILKWIKQKVDINRLDALEIPGRNPCFKWNIWKCLFFPKFPEVLLGGYVLPDLKLVYYHVVLLVRLKRIKCKLATWAKRVNYKNNTLTNFTVIMFLEVFTLNEAV